MPLKVVIIEDHLLVAEGVKKMVETSDLNMKVVGIHDGGDRWEKLFRNRQVDLVLLDLNLQGRNGLDLLEPLKELAPEARIIIVTGYKNSKVVKQAFLGGADGFVLKSAPFSELETGIRTVLQDNTFMGTGVQVTTKPKNGIVKNGHFQDAFSVRYQLTKREQEILELITQAFSNKEIARKLFISDQTVSVHRKNIMRKLGVSNTVSLVKAAQGLTAN
ncbi:MAG: response regulator transcription factor [Saprospiraceae bacterium]|nr:response regulator transcription factor [Saprospiraceae bacterium]